MNFFFFLGFINNCKNYGSYRAKINLNFKGPVQENVCTRHADIICTMHYLTNHAFCTQHHDHLAHHKEARSSAKLILKSDKISAVTIPNLFHPKYNSTNRTHHAIVKCGFVVALSFFFLSRLMHHVAPSYSSFSPLS